MPACLETSRNLPSPFVVVEKVLAARESFWPAKHREPLPETKGIRPGLERFLHFKMHVVRNENVEQAVAIVVEKRAARVPAVSCSGQTGVRAYVLKGAVALVAVENIVTVVGQQQIDAAVIVEITRADPLAPASVLQARLLRGVSKRAVPLVAIEAMGSGFLLCAGKIEPRAVNQKDIPPAVIVKVKDSNSVSCHLQDVSFLVLSSIHIGRGQPYRGRDIAELDLGSGKIGLGSGRGARDSLSGASHPLRENGPCRQNQAESPQQRARNARTHIGQTSRVS